MIFLEDQPDSGKGGSELSLLDLAVRAPEKKYLYYRIPGDLLSQYSHSGCNFQHVPTPNYRFLSSLRFFLTHVPIRDRAIYVNHYQNLPFGALYKALYGQRLYCHLRLPPPKNLGNQLKLAILFVDQFFAVSSFTQRQWQYCLSSIIDSRKVTSIHNGVCTQQFIPSAVKFDQPTIFFAARNVPYKGLSSLIRALEFLPHHYRLLVLGRFNTYTNTERIQFIGQVSREEVPIILSQCHIAVMPSEWPEPFGKVLIESMACNVPAIGSDIGGIPEVVIDKSHLFQPKDSYQLAQVIKTKIESNASYSYSYRDYVIENFDIEKQSQKVFNLIFDKTT